MSGVEQDLKTFQTHLNSNVSKLVWLVSYPYQARTDTCLLNMISIKFLGEVQHVIEELFSREVILRVRWGK